MKSTSVAPIENFSLMCQPPTDSITRHPVEVNIDSNKLNQILARYLIKCYSYFCRIQSIVISTQISELKDKEDPGIVIINVDGLRSAHEILINSNTVKALGYINLNEIHNWKEIKKHDNQISLTFGYTSDTSTVHSSFPFELHDTSDIKQFTITLITGKKEVLSFPGKVLNTPIATLTIEIYRK